MDSGAARLLLLPERRLAVLSLILRCHLVQLDPAIFLSKIVISLRFCCLHFACLKGCMHFWFLRPATEVT